jgi:hypothetical protein
MAGRLAVGLDGPVRRRYRAVMGRAGVMTAEELLEYGHEPYRTELIPTRPAR